MDNMKKTIFILFSLTLLFLAFRIPAKINAQMMGNFQVNENETTELANNINTGKKISEDLINKQVSCSKLTNEDLEKLGEYFMSQMMPDLNRHAYMNKMMSSMGNSYEEQMHISLGTRQSGCTLSSGSSPQRYFPMMGLGGMMGTSYGFLLPSVFGVVFQVLVIGILILLLIYLWQRIKK